MNGEIRKTIILENYQNPKNRGLVDDKSYDIIKNDSKTCIDQIDLQIKVLNGIVVDARFDGEACAICTSSTSILISLILNKPLSEIDKIIDNFVKMINEEEYDEDILEEAIVYSDISKQPNRKNCALLTWKGLRNYIDDKKNNIF